MFIEDTEISEVKVLNCKVFGDNRGWFTETYSKPKLKEVGIDYDFVQDNHSFSAQKGTLRGLHFQNYPYAQTKLIRCTKGKILDVAVDLRKGSKTFKKWIKVELSEENKKQLLIPKGFAHGFLTLTENVEVQYKVDNVYAPSCDRSVRFDDKEMGVEWGISEPILSDKDKNAPLLKDSDCSFLTKALVTGVKGQLGFDVVRRLKKDGYECLGVDIDDFDITNESQTRDFIKEYKPNVVVHCSAYTAVDKAEDETQKCFDVNVTGSLNIAKACKEIDAKMILISTDYVYGGSGDLPFEIDSPVSPLSTYGKTKLQAEIECKKVLEKLFIIRTSWVFGKNGNNFVKTMLKLAKERDAISVVNDQIGSPTYTVDLADFIFYILNTDKYGVYHCSNEALASWYDFAVEIFRSQNVKINAKPIPTCEYKTKAQRPLNSRLSKKCLIDCGYGVMPTWQDALKRYFEEQNTEDKK